MEASTIPVESGVQMDSGDYLKAWLKIPSDQGANLTKSLDPEAYVKAYWNDKTRPDGRMFPQARPTKIVSSLLKHSAGSALIKQGGTKVLSAMTLQIGQPAPDSPDHGDVIVTVTTPDQTSHSDVLQSWLQRMLDDLLPPQLNLMTGKACIRLTVTVLILQDDGNLRDVALMACMAAWKDTTLPTMDHLTEHQGKLWWTESPITSLDRTPMNEDDDDSSSKSSYRISLSMGVLEKNGKAMFLVDPSSDESPYTKGYLTVVVTLPSRSLQLEYAGSIALTATDLALASKMAGGRADELSKLLF
jgi:exosome complex RNA-binding protein Rrp42 (RNase PH superfamily)